jgi:putative flippase GtrA
LKGHAAIFRQFLTFAGVGALATGIQYVILFLGVTFLGADPVAASTAGFALSALVNYLLNHRVTFRSELAHRRALPRFVTVVALGLVLTALLMDLGVHRLGLHYFPVQVATTGIVLLWNFIASRRWTFYDSSGKGG